MYQLYIPKHIKLADDLRNFHNCVLLGNWMMIVNLIVLTACLVMTYGVEHYFTLTEQAVAHIVTIFSAGAFKLGYVIRCVGMHGLGHKIF